MTQCLIKVKMSPSSSNTRWCPTPEQLMVLDELYRRGLRTPTAAQIQKIAAHLSLYGKIQGKNVFYWFQNHKARDRQKLRKKLASQLLYSFPHNHFLHIQGSGMYGEARDGGVMRQYSWRPDPPKDSNLMRMYGHDHSSIVFDVGPTQLHCCNNNNSSSSKPLQTLELFPLTSPSSTADDQKTPTSSFSL